MASENPANKINGKTENNLYCLHVQIISIWHEKTLHQFFRRTKKFLKVSQAVI